MKKILQEFKQFAMRGNVIDMAVGMHYRRCFWQNRIICRR